LNGNKSRKQKLKKGVFVQIENNKTRGRKRAKKLSPPDKLSKQISSS